MIETSGNLLDCTDGVVAHIINCKSEHYAGLADALFTAFPWAEPMAPRRMGRVLLTQRPIGARGPAWIANCCAQIYPGAKHYGSDTADARLRAYAQCLDEIAQQLLPQTLYLSEGTGSGLAGGNRAEYHAVASNFQKTHPNWKVVMIIYT